MMMPEGGEQGARRLRHPRSQRPGPALKNESGIFSWGALLTQKYRLDLEKTFAER